MTKFAFEDFARTTLGGAFNMSDQSPLSNSQIDRITIFLTSPASGPDGNISFAEFLESKINESPPSLPSDKDYIAFSGRDRNEVPNSLNALEYSKNVNKRAGTIAETPWGNYITNIESLPDNHPDMATMANKLKAFMDSEGVAPWGNNYANTLRDIMWNAGSPKFFENAIATGKPRSLSWTEHQPTAASAISS